MAIGGNADSVCREAERWAATGIDQMIFMFPIGHTTQDQIMRAIEIVGEKVIPRFAGLAGQDAGPSEIRAVKRRARFVPRHVAHAGRWRLACARRVLRTS